MLIANLKKGPVNKFKNHNIRKLTAISIPIKVIVILLIPVFNKIIQIHEEAIHYKIYPYEDIL